MRKIPIVAARVAANMTQQQLADKMGVSRQTILNWEQNVRKMRRPYVYLFCGLTGFDIEDLILPDGSAKRKPEGVA